MQFEHYEYSDQPGKNCAVFVIAYNNIKWTKNEDLQKSDCLFSNT